MANEFSPILSSNPSPERAIQAPNLQGPITPPVPAARLDKAFNPGPIGPAQRVGLLDENRTVPKVDILGGIAAIAGDVAGILNTVGSFGGDNRTQQEKEDEALRPYFEQINSIASARDQGVNLGSVRTRATVVSRELAAAYPTLAPKMQAYIENTLGFKSAAPVVDFETIRAENVTKWTQDTPVGRLSMFAAMRLPEEARGAFIERRYTEDQALEAQLVESNTRLSLAQNDNKLFDELESGLITDLSIKHSDRINSFIQTAIPVGAELDAEFNADTTVQDLITMRQTFERDFNNDYASGGARPGSYNQAINNALAPIDNMIKAIQQSGDELKRTLEVRGNQLQLDFMEAAKDTELGPLLANREVFNSMLEQLRMNNEAGFQEVATVVGAKLKADANGKSQLNNPQTSNDPQDFFNKEFTSSLRGDKELRTTTANVSNGNLKAIDLTQPDMVQFGVDNTFDLLSAIAAGDDILSPTAFNEYLIKNLDKIIYLTEVSGNEALTGAVKATAVKQFTLNKTKLDTFMTNMPAGFTLVQTEDGKIDFDFNPDAFDKAEDGITERVKWLLDKESLPATRENITSVVARYEDIITSAGGTEGRGFSGGTGLNVVKNSLANVSTYLVRLNQINDMATSISKVADSWSKEVGAVLAGDIEVGQFAAPSTLSAKEQKELREAQRSYPSFGSQEEAQIAAESGQLKNGDRIVIDGVTVVVEIQEDDNEN